MEVIPRVTERLVETFNEIFKQKFCTIYSMVEDNTLQSPIEQILYTELLVNQIKGAGPAEIICQFEIEKYRIDIALTIKMENKFYKVAVECDGHDYHERTEEQARRDKEKDRLLQSQGWLVARFTGKQINENPKQCIDDIYLMVLLHHKHLRGEGIERGMDQYSPTNMEALVVGGKKKI